MADLGIFFYPLYLCAKISRYDTGHSSLVDYLAQVKEAKNYPTHSECVLNQVWVPMSTTQNIRGVYGSS